MTRTVEVFPDLEALSRGAAALVTHAAQESVALRGRFLLALSGGHTPGRLFDLLAAGTPGGLPWPAVHLFWSDERWVPPSHPASNFKLAQERLLSRVPIPESGIHRVPTEMDTPETGAAAYEEELTRVAGEPPALDLVLLGMGGDGHTASLFPGSSALEERARWVIHANAPEGIEPRQRITLTLQALSAARTVVFLVSGEGKARAVHAALAETGPGDPVPASRVAASGKTLWLIDREAAGNR